MYFFHEEHRYFMSKMVIKIQILNELQITYEIIHKNLNVFLIGKTVCNGNDDSAI